LLAARWLPLRLVHQPPGPLPPHRARHPDHGPHARRRRRPRRRLALEGRRRVPGPARPRADHPARAAEVRAEAESVIARLEAGEPPFCDPWPHWRPDPSWGLPALPPGWEKV